MISQNQSDLIEFYREHRNEIDILSDEKYLFVLTIIQKLRPSNLKELSQHLALEFDELVSIGTKLQNAGMIVAGNLNDPNTDFTLSPNGIDLLKIFCQKEYTDRENAVKNPYNLKIVTGFHYFLNVLYNKLTEQQVKLPMAAAKELKNPMRALVLNTMDSTTVELTDGPYFYLDGSIFLKMKVSNAYLPLSAQVRREQIKVDLLFVPIDEIVHTVNLSPSEKEQEVEFKLPIVDSDSEKFLKNLREVAPPGPITLPLEAIAFRIRW